MTRQEIEDVVRTIISAELRVAPARVGPSTNLASELGADSLDALTISIQLENAFSLKLPDRALARFTTLDSIIEALQEAANAPSIPVAPVAAAP